MSNFRALSSYLWCLRAVLILPLKKRSQKQISIKQFNYIVLPACAAFVLQAGYKAVLTFQCLPNLE